MKVAITPTGEDTGDKAPPATMDVEFVIETQAAGHRREDGLTAAQVEEEMRLSDGS